MLLCLSAAAIAQKAPPSKPFERFNGCVLKPDEWTDGDSFRVQLPDGRFETFRLYFVDTTESRSRGYYAMVVTRSGRDLNELLVSNGLARIYGTRTPLPDGRDSRTYLAHLPELENEARAAKRGAWGEVHR